MEDSPYIIAELSANDQWLLYEFYKRGLTRSEIAASLQSSVKGVEARLYRMRSRLRVALLAANGAIADGVDGDHA